MNTIVHISDLHFGREKALLKNQLLESIAKINPRLIVVSGDLTQRAREKEFISARQFLSSFCRPTLIISGNHDMPACNLVDRFLTPWRKWRRFAQYDLEPFRQDEGYAAVGINTARRCGAPLDWSRGRIDNDQLHKTEKRLQAIEQDSLRMVVAHHPFWLPRRYEHKGVVGGRDKALAALKRAGVDIIFGGHVHSAYTIILGGIIICHSGTAISDRLDADAENSFKIVQGDRQRLTVETMEWKDTSYEPLEKRLFERISDHWQESTAPWVSARSLNQ